MSHPTDLELERLAADLPCCPFCAGRPWVDDTQVPQWGVWLVRCGLSKCGIEGPSSSTLKGALEAWSTRFVDRGPQ